jgi:hypothetical protein
MPTLPFRWSAQGGRTYEKTQAVRLLDGSFVVVWSGEIIVDQRAVIGSFFQRFSALGLEIGPRVAFSSLNRGVDVTALADGGFAVVSLGGINETSSVFRYDLDGALIQTRFLPAINPNSFGFDTGRSNMVGLEFGGFVLARAVTDSGVTSVHVWHFDVLGRVRPGPTLVESEFTQHAPTILALENGGYRLFVAREMEAGIDGAPSRFRIIQRDFDMFGTPATGNSAAIPSVLTDGAVTAMEVVATGGGFSALVLKTAGGTLMLQAFSPTGARVGGVVTLSQDAASFEIKAMAGGGFVVAYADQVTSEVLVQRYLPDGTPVGATFASGLSSGPATAVALVDLEGGGFGLFVAGDAMLFDQGTDRGDYVVFETAASFNGMGGNDFIIGSAFGDALAGGSGVDIIKGRGGDDVINLGDGRDDTWEQGQGGAGNDMIRQGSGASRLYGGQGDDVLDGGAGRDLLWGGDGDDALYGGAGDDTLSGDAGLDVMRGGEGNDVLFGGTFADRLFGQGGDDHLFGGDGNDVIFGGAGNDSLVGGAGGDQLSGDGGDDTLTGGTGNDQFLFRVLGAGSNVITDFQTGDRINFRNADRAVVFADLQIDVTGATTTIALAGNDFSITLFNRALPLTAADFLF